MSQVHDQQKECETLVLQLWLSGRWWIVFLLFGFVLAPKVGATGSIVFDQNEVAVDPSSSPLKITATYRQFTGAIIETNIMTIDTGSGPIVRTNVFSISDDVDCSQPGTTLTLTATASVTWHTTDAKGNSKPGVPSPLSPPAKTTHIYILGVGSITADQTTITQGQTATLTAIATPAGKGTIGQVHWEVSYNGWAKKPWGTTGQHDHD